MLRRNSKLLDHLLTFLNIAWTVEVPAEMIVHRILGMAAKLRFVVILELFKYYVLVQSQTLLLGPCQG